jgi:hypothetical protein
MYSRPIIFVKGDDAFIAKIVAMVEGRVVRTWEA